MKNILIFLTEEDDDETGACEEEEASEVERELLDGAGELLVAVARNDPAGVIADGFVDILTVAGEFYKIIFKMLNNFFYSRFNEKARSRLKGLFIGCSGRFVRRFRR